jgi:hypothetical protein
VVKLPLNQLLAPDAVTRAIKVEHFHLRLAPINEDKQLATVWIFLQLVFDHGRQPVE